MDDTGEREETENRYGGEEYLHVPDEHVHRIVVEAAPAKRRSVLVRFLVGGLIAMLILALLSSSLMMTPGLGGRPTLNEEYIEGDYEHDSRVAVLSLSGPIFDYGGSFRGPVEVISEGLRKAAADEKVKSVIIEVNSPGGGITASDDMWRRVEEFKQGGKKVVVLMRDIAASGGYYVSAGADSIVAQPTTVTGSIGVLIGAINYKGLMDLVGVKDMTFKSGEVKDVLSPTRDVTEKEKELIQEIVTEMFARFKQVVMDGRQGKMTPADFDKVDDGRILTADQALEAHMIDQIGYLDDAVKEARRLAGIRDSAVVRYWRRPSRLEMLLQGSSAKGRTIAPWEDPSVHAGLRGSWSPFLYMWTGPR